MADLNDLQNDWDSQPTYSEEHMTEIANLVQSRSDTLRDTLFKRDMVETGAALFIVVFFAPALFITKGLLAKAGIWIAILGAVEIAVLMNWVRRLDRADFATLPLKDFLASELRSIDRQIAMLRYIAWWYLLPLYAGASLFVFGVDWAATEAPRSLGDFWFSLMFGVGYFVMCFFIWRANQRTRAVQLEPLRDVLQRTYDSVTALESPENESDLISSLAETKLEDTSPALMSKKKIGRLFGLLLSLGLIIIAVAVWFEFNPPGAAAPQETSSGGATTPVEPVLPLAETDTDFFQDANSVDEIVAPLIEAKDLQGVSVGIVTLDSTGNLASATHHYGLVTYRDNKDESRPPNDRTLYELGGLTRVFTGILLATAVEQNEVALEAPLSSLVPPDVRVPAFEGREISLLDMMTDRSGLPRLPNNMNFAFQDPYRDYTAGMAEEFLGQHKLKSAPGTQRVYSILGVAYLGHALTKVAGENDYDALLRKRLTAPLGMLETRVLVKNEQRNIPIGHNQRGKEISPWHYADMPGSGGVRSTIEDMNRLMEAFIQPQSTEIGNAIELAFQQHSEVGVTTGLGWVIKSDGTRWNNGATGGFRSSMFINRERGVGVCVLSDKFDNVVDLIAARIMELESQGDAEEK